MNREVRLREKSAVGEMRYRVISEGQVVYTLAGRREEMSGLLLVAEFVANSPNGQDHLGIVRVVLDFGAQAVYV